MFLDVPGFKSFLLPVGIGIFYKQRRGGIVGRFYELFGLCIGTGLIHQFLVLLRVGHVVPFYNMLNAVIAIVIQSELAALAAFGGDDDNAIGCTGTVNGGG